jgi:hypothetical protein
MAPTPDVKPGACAQSIISADLDMDMDIGTVDLISQTDEADEAEWCKANKGEFV